jgi:hypothetical protein
VRRPHLRADVKAALGRLTRLCGHRDRRSGSSPYLSGEPLPIKATMWERKRPSRSSAGVALVLVGALFGLGLDACLQTEGQRRAEFERRADEILPPEARVLLTGYDDCVELAPTPSCSKVVFEMDRLDSARRAALVREEAARNGWTVTHSDDAQGGWSVFLKKDEFTAVVFLWRPEVYEVDCKGRPDPNSDADRFCFNTLNLSR